MGTPEEEQCGVHGGKLLIFAAFVVPANLIVKRALEDIVPDDIIKGSLSEPLGTILQARSNSAHSRYVLPDFEVKKLKTMAPGDPDQQPRVLQVSQVRMIVGRPNLSNSQKILQ